MLSFSPALRLVGLSALLVAASITACSATSAPLVGGGGQGGGGTGAGGDEAIDAGPVPEGSAYDAGACAAESKKGEQRPLDMYIMLDQSGSMSNPVSGGDSAWHVVTGALKTFVKQPGVAGVGVGLQYFPLLPGGKPCTLSCASDGDCGAWGPCISGICNACAFGGTDSCDSVDYTTPEVEIAPLPGVLGALLASLDAHHPTLGTPTSAALQGAIDHARAWGQANPDHVVIDVLATDGDPKECDTDLQHIKAIAAAGADGAPQILTFVIGVGSSLTTLNDLAKAGGTGSAFMIDTDADVNQQLLDALGQIRSEALECSYLIPLPSKGDPDFSTVNVQYTKSGGVKVVLPRVQDQASCPTGWDAWYYDDNAAPKQIVLCNVACSDVAADLGAQIDILLGCATYVK